jgi:hypothetical protein
MVSNHSSDCLGTTIDNVRSRTQDVDGTMSSDLLTRLTDLTPEELDRLSHGELMRHHAPLDGVYRTIDVIRAVLSFPPA